MTFLYVLLGSAQTPLHARHRISNTFPVILYILSRFLGALRIMLSTRNKSYETSQSHDHAVNSEDTLTSAASLAEDTTARFSL